ATTLGAMTVHPVFFDVFPSTIGDFSIVGCRIKVANCGERDFMIYPEGRPAAPGPELVKRQGQNARTSDDETAPRAQALRMTIPATAAMTVPLLELEYTSAPEQRLMLLNGEMQTVNIVLRNTSKVPAHIFDVRDNECNMFLTDPGTFLTENDTSATLDEPVGYCVVPPGETVLFSCDVVGHAGVARADCDVHYRVAHFGGYDAYSRLCRVPFTTTVLPCLRLSEPDFFNVDNHRFTLSFDITNAWRVSLGVSIMLRYPPGELKRVFGVEEEELLVVVPPLGATTRVSIDIYRLLFLWDGQKCDTPEEMWGLLWKRVVVVWDEWDGGSRSGRANFRDLAVTREMLEVAMGRV
ncbi:hypothetical protein LTR53_017505, partial [Teratosphaeriaceae sp. CCFEE 6253]